MTVIKDSCLLEEIPELRTVSIIKTKLFCGIIEDVGRI